MSRSEPWTIADVIDFESFLAADAESRAEVLHERDSAIGRKLVRDSAGGRPPRRELFHGWLAARRPKDAAATPGAAFSSTAGLALWVAVIGGFVLGCGLCGGLLHYKGVEPVNVSVFFAWTVVLQVAVLLAAVLGWGLSGITGSLRAFHPLRSAFATLLWAAGAAVRRLPGPQREKLRAAFAVMERRHGLYHPLTVWPALALTQAFAVAWNLGILATLLGHVATTDLAFGWQSTLAASPERVFEIVRTVAAPWSGWIAGAHPTLDQIRGSRFIYSAGVETLEMKGAVSWWPFLVCSVAFYGLLIRAALLGLCAWRTRRALAGLRFDHYECNSLHRRLTGPLMELGAGGPGLVIPSGAREEPHTAPAGSVCLCLYASEMEGEWPVAEFAPFLERAFGWRCIEVLPAAIDRTTGNDAILSALDAPAARDAAAIVIFIPARRAPIVAIALFLKGLQAGARPGLEIVIVLVARDEAGQLAAAPDETRQYWRNFTTIHQLAIGIETWPAAVADVG